MKAIILARVSDKKQDSNEAQIARILEYTKYKSLHIWKTYEIKESSTKGDRKKFQEIVNEIKLSQEPIALVVDTVDRLQRSFKESVLLDDLRKAGKIELHFYRENLVIHKNSNSADLLRWDMAVMFARSYILQLSDNVKRKFDQKRENGEWSGKAPIGYKNIGERNKRDIIPDPDTAHLVRKIFEWYSSGNFSMLTLRNKIAQAGLTNRYGKKLALSMIEHILKNPFYYGEMRSKGKLYPHKYVPLISRQLFDKCSYVRQTWGKKPFKYAAKPFILRGLVRCNKCGCSISPELKKKKYVYYSCTNAKKSICNEKNYIREERLLIPVYEILNAFSQIKEETISEIVNYLADTVQARNKHQEATLCSLHNELERLQGRLQRLTDLLLDGSIPKDIYDLKVGEFKSKQHEVRGQIELYSVGDEGYHLVADTVLHLAKNALAIFNSSEITEKRMMLNLLLQNSHLNGKKLEFSIRSPFNDILLFTKQPTGCPSLDAFRTLNWKAIEQDLFHLLHLVNKSDLKEKGCE